MSTRLLASIFTSASYEKLITAELPNQIISAVAYSVLLCALLGLVRYHVTVIPQARYAKRRR